MMGKFPTSKFETAQAPPPWLRVVPCGSVQKDFRQGAFLYILGSVLAIGRGQPRERLGQGVTAMSLGCLLMFSVLWVGCGGGDSDEPELDLAEQESEGNPLTAPVDYLGAVNQAQKSSADKLALVGLQQAIQQFTVLEERRPKNLSELVSSGYIARLPEVPRGQELSYDPQTGLVSIAPRSGD